MGDEKTIPDSWERLEGDAGKTSCAYFGRSGLCVGCPALAISQKRGEE